MRLVEGGVPLALGVDNIHDLFMPMVDGDLWFESRVLMEATRCYDLDLIAELATAKWGFKKAVQNQNLNQLETSSLHQMIR